MGVKSGLKKVGRYTTVGLRREINRLKEENKSIREQLKEIDNLKAQVNEIECLKSELKGIQELDYTYKYKMWEFNNSTNIILYENYLRDAKKKKNYNPLVSIIIPVYNGSNYLKYAIEAALNQTYKNIEIIVVNDGSKDDNKSEKIAKKYGDKIKYFYKENGGVSSALNYGIKKMKGDYFAWLSHDDYIEKNHIEKLVELISIEGNEKVIPFSSFKIIDENGNLDVEQTVIAQTFYMDYKISVLKNYYSLLQGEINGGSVLIPKEAFDKCGLFDEKLRITQERDMWSRLIKEYHFINVPYDTASIRVHSNQVTNTANNVAEKSDEKCLEILNNVSKKEMEELEYNEAFFYTKMYYFYKNNGKTYLEEKMKEKIEKVKEK
jgi:hypothetical protein